MDLKKRVCIVWKQDLGREGPKRTGPNCPTHESVSFKKGQMCPSLLAKKNTVVPSVHDRIGSRLDFQHTSVTKSKLGTAE